jgi:hypothetical protein
MDQGGQRLAAFSPYVEPERTITGSVTGARAGVLMEKRMIRSAGTFILIMLTAGRAPSR